MAIPPAVPLFVAATANVTIRIYTRTRFSWPVATAVDVMVALALHFTLTKGGGAADGTATTVTVMGPWWGPVTSLVSQWYRLLEYGQKDDPRNIKLMTSNHALSRIRRMLLSDGPLGKGGYKVVQVLVAVMLWRWQRNEWPDIRLGPLPTSILPYFILMVLSLGVNAVLYLWAKTTQSRGEHRGVNAMVQSSLRRDLTGTETVRYAFLALVNAFCEEVTSRWFWWHEFAHYYPSHPHLPNLAQAAVFGMWHLHGIPSGWPGVALTSVYGWIMGFLMETVNRGGLFFPLVAHAVADFYIFRSIARGRATAGGEGSDKAS
jgi:hypothetical protein